MTSEIKAKVFLLFHSHEFEDESADVKLVGVYSTEAAAMAARAQVMNQPGFSDYPDGFTIDGYVLDETHWAEGFVATEPDSNSTA